MLTFQRDILIQAGMLLRRLGFRNDPSRQWVRAALLHGVLLAAFGIFLPFLQGVDFYDSILLGAYQAISVVFSAPAAAIRLKRPDMMRARI